MDKIFIGLIFIFFDIKFSFGISFMIFNINLLPNFVGYILIYLGVKELRNYSEIFKKLLPVISIGMVVSIIIDTVAFLMIDTGNVWLYASHIALNLLLIFILYKIIIGIRALEKKEERLYGVKLLFNTWVILSIVIILSYSGYFIPGIYSMILLIGYVLISLIFLIIFYRTKSLYNSYH